MLIDLYDNVTTSYTLTNIFQSIATEPAECRFTQCNRFITAISLLDDARKACKLQLDPHKPDKTVLNAEVNNDLSAASRCQIDERARHLRL